MQHINAPPPPVSLKRPEVPRRVEAAVERALAKDPAARFPTMAAFADELEACLAEAFERRGQRRDRHPPVVRPAARRAEPPRSGRRAPRGALSSWLVLAVLAARGDRGRRLRRSRRSGLPARARRRAPTRADHGDRGVAAYDPEGDGHENNGEVPLATDGNPATAWQTEHYAHRRLRQPQVGRRARRRRRLVGQRSSRSRSRRTRPATRR